MGATVWHLTAGRVKIYESTEGRGAGEGNSKRYVGFLCMKQDLPSGSGDCAERVDETGGREGIGT